MTRINQTSLRKVAFFIAKVNKSDMVVLRELLETGEMKPVVERCYDVSEAADAFPTD